MNLDPDFDTDPDNTALARYLSNEATAEQRQSIEWWMMGDPARRTMMQRIAALWDQPRRDVERWESKPLLDNFLKRRDVEAEIKIWRE